MVAESNRSVRVATAVVVAGLLLVGVAGGWFVFRGPHDELATLTGHKGGAFSLALSPRWRRVASGGGDGAVRIWNVANKKQKTMLAGHGGTVLAVAWSPDGATLASGGADKSARLWNVSTGENKGERANLPSAVLGLTFSSDGKLLAAAVDRDVYVWDGGLSGEPKILRGHKLYISGLTFLPGSHQLATFGCDKTVRVWDVDTDKQLASMPGPTGHCHGLALSGDGKTLACIGGGRVHLFDLERRSPIETIDPKARTLYGVAFSPDQRTLALGSEDKVVVIWDLATKRVRHRLRGHGFTVGPMTFLPDGRTLVTAGYDSTLKLWNVE